MGRVIKAVWRRVLGAIPKHHVEDYVADDPKLCIRALRKHNEWRYTFGRVAPWPERIESFEDLAFLFHLSQANYGVCLLAFDEAAYMYRLCRGIEGGQLAEIGRFKGGSTFLMAAAVGPGTRIDSYDLHVISTYNGDELDRALSDALQRYELADRVHLHVEDSRRVNPPTASCDLVFIDGDHSYDGAKQDFLHWKDAVKPGGQLVFHDAVRTRKFAKGAPGLRELMPEVEREHGEAFEKVQEVGSLVHFRRRGE